MKWDCRMGPGVAGRALLMQEGPRQGAEHLQPHGLQGQAQGAKCLRLTVLAPPKQQPFLLCSSFLAINNCRMLPKALIA